MAMAEERTVQSSQMRVRLWVKRITRRFRAMAPAMFMPARSLDLSVPNRIPANVVVSDR